MVQLQKNKKNWAKIRQFLNSPKAIFGRTFKKIYLCIYLQYNNVTKYKKSKSIGVIYIWKNCQNS